MHATHAAPPARGNDEASQATPYKLSPMPRLRTQVQRRPDGVLILSSQNALERLPQRCFAEFVPIWAQRCPGRLAFCERDESGQWRSLTWQVLWQQVQSVAASLLEMGLGQEQPLMPLSGNSIEQAVLCLAAEYVGIPSAPVSPAYSLLSKDFSRLKFVRELVQPGAFFVQSTPPLSRALQALELNAAQVIAVHGAGPGQRSWQDLVSLELTPERRQMVEAAHAAISPEHTARVLFTSGSTGVPKGVVTSYRNASFLVNYLQTLFGTLAKDDPVFLDWLPWHHGFGALVNFGRSLVVGGTHYIDDGRPLPGLFDRTVKNLREVSPVMFASVPSAWAMLATELERDPQLAQSLFARAVSLGYGGASLPVDVWQRIQQVAEKTMGQRIAFNSGLAATETTAGGTWHEGASDDVGNIGVPGPGAEIKLLPLESMDGRYEIRVRGEFMFAGYLKRPELTREAYDEEGFFRLGDAVRLADPQDPGQGLRFAGRLVEDFKLTSGTWVRTGAVRLGLIDRCAPLITDAVICGHDCDYVAALAWPNIEACRRLSPQLATALPAELVRHPLVVQALSERLGSPKGTASLEVRRVMLMAEPPSLDANEIADKGYVNQAATRARRAALVRELLQAEPPAHVACAG